LTAGRTERCSVLQVANYSAAETLRDGRKVEIRALRTDDRDEFLWAVDQSSAESLYRRFFSRKRGFTQAEIEYFTNVDFVNHVALLAILCQNNQSIVIGGGRYVVVGPGKAEVAFVVIDQFQGVGCGAALMRHLGILGRKAGLKELVAEVLEDNTPMLRVFERSGFGLRKTRGGGTIHVTLQLIGDPN
jgi:GNAT superfamily N-acetyltransferase